MTTPERGLFERITSAIHCDLLIKKELEQIKAICADFEQRLAEAEAKWLAAARAHDEILVRMNGVEQQRQDTAMEIAQLRARCGELEGLTERAYSEGYAQGVFDQREGVPSRLRGSRWETSSVREALTATPPPAQEQR